jgi:gamma-glutamylcyclotransferase (GGCT)/AIG2-like uncharacterized protein YtfP
MTSHLSVFVYGTLKPGEANFDLYCSSKAISRHRAYIHGELYDFPRLGYPGVIHGRRQVNGYVLTFADAGILTALDELEDYHPDRQPAENDYTRELVITYTLEGIPSIPAWAYFMTSVGTASPLEHRIQQWGGILLVDGWWEGSRSTYPLPPDRSVEYTRE